MQKRIIFNSQQKRRLYRWINVYIALFLNKFSNVVITDSLVSTKFTNKLDQSFKFKIGWLNRLQKDLVLCFVIGVRIKVRIQIIDSCLG